MHDQLPPRNHPEHIVAVLGTEHVHRMRLQALGQHQFLLHALTEIEIVQQLVFRLGETIGYAVDLFLQRLQVLVVLYRGYDGIKSGIDRPSTHLHQCVGHDDVGIAVGGELATAAHHAYDAQVFFMLHH